MNLESFEKLITIDITNNNFVNFENLCKSLKTIPNLAKLNINLSTQNQALEILESLPNLLYLNGRSTKEEDDYVIDIDEVDIKNITLDQFELDKFNKIFQKIVEKLKIQKSDNEKSFIDKYHSLIKNEIDQINNFIENQVPNYLYSSEILKSKNKINIFLLSKLADCLDKKEIELIQVFKEISQSLSQNNENFSLIIEKIDWKIREKTDLYKKVLNFEIKEKNLVEMKINSFEETFSKLNFEKELAMKEFQDQINDLNEKIQKLENENKQLSEKILKKTRDFINESIIQKKNDEQSPQYQMEYNSSKTKTNGKLITKKMMKEIIEEIYESKNLFDKRCLENKMPRETMEQHMYTFLNQKYGLKNLIIEWATNIVQGIKLYSSEDNDICVFGKILKNECEEEFRYVLQKVKTTILELLNVYVKGKFPNKNSTEIKDLINSKINGYIIEEEWREIIYFMYEEDDANTLNNKIISIIKKNFQLTKNQIESKKLTRGEINQQTKNLDCLKILFSDLQKLILDFQLRSHDKFLRNFVFLFKRFDTDYNGILSEQEFIRLIQTINIFHEEELDKQVERLLNIIDPYNKKQVTFSECISLFTIETIEDKELNKKITILEKIANDDHQLLNII